MGIKKIFQEESAKGLLDVIRCDEEDYLIWKWRPSDPKKADRANSIRLGSRLRVKDGSVAVFVYQQNDSVFQEFIEGPIDKTLITANFPFLNRIYGAVYDGDTPFQAEVYFINLAEVIQIPFAVPYFDIYDPRYADFGVPVAVRGMMTFNITDYKDFIKLHRLDSFNLDKFKIQVRDLIIGAVKNIVANEPAKKNISALQIETTILDIKQESESYLRQHMRVTFGVFVSQLAISTIEVDKTSAGYRSLLEVSTDISKSVAMANKEANVQNIKDMQQINAENMKETLRLQREESQYAMHKQTQSANMAAFQIEKQAEVGIAGAEALGQMGANGAMNMGEGGGMNPAAMMTGIAMGGAIGQNLIGTMNGMMTGVNGSAPSGNTQVPPVPPVMPSSYNVAVNGQSTGPFDMQYLSQLVKVGSLTQDSLVWKPGMQNWEKAGSVQELQVLFGTSTDAPVPPPIPMS